MTTFEKGFTPTDTPKVDHPSALGFMEQGGRTLPPPGAYNDGLLSILDEVTGSTLLQSWQWLVGPNCQALITTGFGDVYYWNERQAAIYYLNVQHAMIDFVDRSIVWILDEFLLIPDIQQDVLRLDLLARLVDAQRPLSYLECFILTPWQMLGGDESRDEFDIGKCSVYLDLVGQAHSDTERR